MAVSLVELGNQWREHPLGRRRAAGGINALSGFWFQLAVSLERFLDLAETGNPNVQVAFECLSDLASMDGGPIYLLQVKRTLTTATAKDVAQEALAVDAFLEECHPGLRNMFVYEVRCARRESGDPRTINATQLNLSGGDVERWERLRARFREPSVRSNPYLGLLSRLFARVDDPFGVVAMLTGELLRMVAEKDDPEQIARRLLEIISSARAAQTRTPPPRLLTVEDLSCDEGGSGILLGQRPTIEHLAKGYFMPRGERSEDAAQQVLELLRRDVQAEDQRLPVCWLSGASGAGKSVLLLQVLVALLTEQGLAVHSLAPSNASLSDALEYWNDAQGDVVLAIDDLYAPARRGVEQWDRLTGLALDPSRLARIVILTTGTEDYIAALRQRIGETGAFVVEDVPVSNLSEHEQERYHAWYQRRTGAEPAPTPAEPLFVVAAFLAAVGAEELDTVAEFAERFRARAEARGLGAALLTALAVNRLGVPAPERLFGADLDALEELVSEDVVERESVNGLACVTIFHQQLADALYSELVSEARVNERARDLSAAFEAFGENAELPAALIETTHKHARRGNPGRETLVRLLELTWRPMWEADPRGRRLPVILAWLFAARGIEFPLAREPYEQQLLSWATALDTPGELVRPACSVLWDACPARREEILTRLRVWLAANPQEGDWAFVCRLALDDEEACDLAESWIQEHPNALGSVEIFVALAHRRSDFARAHLDLILEQSPTSQKDSSLWKLAQQIGYGETPLLGVIARRACYAPTREVIRRAVRHLVVDPTEAAAGVVRGALMDDLAAPGLARFLRVLAVRVPTRSPMAIAVGDVGLAWLKEHPTDPEWQSTWHAVFTRRTPDTTAQIEGLAHRWLAAEPNARGWPGVALMLAQRGTRARRSGARTFFTGDAAMDDQLMTSATQWLAAHPTGGLWSKIFPIAYGNRATAELRDVGRDWLQTGFAAEGWPFVWRELYRGPSGEEFLDLGSDWLEVNSADRHSAIVRSVLQHGLRKSAKKASTAASG